MPAPMESIEVARLRLLGPGHHSGTQPFQELLCCSCDFPHGVIKDLLIGLGRLVKTAHLANELERCGTHVFRRNDKIALAQNLNAAAHTYRVPQAFLPVSFLNDLKPLAYARRPVTTESAPSPYCCSSRSQSPSQAPLNRSACHPAL